MTLRNAFAHSVNTIAVQLADEVGIQAVIDTAKRTGVQSTLPAVPSLALGSAEVSLMEMTRAFGSVAAGVQSIEPYSIRSITGNSRQALYAKPAAGTEVAGQLAASRAMMIDMLQAVVNEGTGKAARIPGIAAGGKTGTTQEYRDAWFIGFSPDLVVGVWVGNDDNSSTNKVTGGDLPASIWHDFVGRALPIVTGRHRSQGGTPKPSTRWLPRAPPLLPPVFPSEPVQTRAPEVKQTLPIRQRWQFGAERFSSRAFSAMGIAARSGPSRGFSGDEK